MVEAWTAFTAQHLVVPLAKTADIFISEQTCLEVAFIDCVKEVLDIYMANAGSAYVWLGVGHDTPSLYKAVGLIGRMVFHEDQPVESFLDPFQAVGGSLNCPELAWCTFRNFELFDIISHVADNTINLGKRFAEDLFKVEVADQE